MINEKQKKFCEEYIIDLNATKAAIRAGYSKRSAEVTASRMLRNANVATYIEKLRGVQMENAGLSASKVIDELKSLGFWSIQDFITDDNSILDLSKLDRAVVRPIVGIKVTETIHGTGKKAIREIKTELKLADKRAALTDLGRHLGIFKNEDNQKPLTIYINGKKSGVST